MTATFAGVAAEMPCPARFTEARSARSARIEQRSPLLRSARVRLVPGRFRSTSVKRARVCGCGGVARVELLADQAPVVRTSQAEFNNLARGWRSEMAYWSLCATEREVRSAVATAQRRCRRISTQPRVDPLSPIVLGERDVQYQRPRCSYQLPSSRSPSARCVSTPEGAKTISSARFGRRAGARPPTSPGKRSRPDDPTCPHRTAR